MEKYKKENAESCEQEAHDLENSLVADRRSFLALAGASAVTASFAVNSTPASALQPADSEGAANALTTEDIRGAERVLGISYTAEQREDFIENYPRQIDAVKAVRNHDFSNGEAPAPAFEPRLPGVSYKPQGNTLTIAPSNRPLPASGEDIAFASVAQLGHWIKGRAITSAALTEIYLKRVKKYGPSLECFVTITAELARQQAAAADKLLAAGTYLGPLHGIPYAVKDLADTKGIRTTWGAEPYKNRIAEQDATLVKLLRDNGAVLLGKATSGALALGDVWFGGITRNPWNLDEGSSGSSAGPASSVAAGLAGFAIGTETLGSIISPANRCGVAGMRPTFGRVSRHGLMALAWSLDKAGPMTRFVEDTAIILNTLNHYDPQDASSIDHGFDYTPEKYKDLRIGFMPSAFEGDNITQVDKDALHAARALGMKLKEVSIPDMPYSALFPIIRAESAAAFDKLIRSGGIDTLRFPARSSSARISRMLSAVDYINMERLRRQVMQVMHDVYKDVDVIIGPNYAESMLLITNYTGQPQIAFRAGFNAMETRPVFKAKLDPLGIKYNVPQAFSVFGPLFAEGPMVHVANMLEAELGAAQARPKL
ncbi:amidase [Kordiimonas aquimaris]|uniref:amidase n=1 Tax=Kordiimonas aquimaris TaxID=707591 RepID=UPI0021D2DA38|nr:amidase [Kordiimonas aquimaris]